MNDSSGKKVNLSSHRQSTSLRQLPKLETFLPKVTDVSARGQSRQNQGSQKKDNFQSINQLYSMNETKGAKPMSRRGMKQTTEEESRIETIMGSSMQNFNNGIKNNSGFLKDTLSPIKGQKQINHSQQAIGVSNSSISLILNTIQNTSTSLSKKQIFMQAPTSSSSSVAQLQMDADQNRLDFMLEKGINFEKSNQLSKFKLENSDQKKEIRRLEGELRRLRQDMENLKQQNQLLTNQNIQMGYLQSKNGNILTEEQIASMEKKWQQNEYFKEKIQQLKNVQEKEMNTLEEKYIEVQRQLVAEREKNKNSISQPQNDILLTNLEYIEQNINKEANSNTIDAPHREFKDVQMQTDVEGHHSNNQLDDFSNLSASSQLAMIQSELYLMKNVNTNLQAESSQLRQYLESSRRENNNQKDMYEKYIKEQSVKYFFNYVHEINCSHIQNFGKDEVIKADKACRDFRKKYEDVMEKVKQLKNNELFNKIFVRNEYSLIMTETLSGIEIQNRERMDRIDLLVSQVNNLQSQLEIEKKKCSKLSEEVDSLNQHIDWMKKRGEKASKQGGTFNYLGLSEEILKLKEVIDKHITIIPDKDNIKVLSHKVEEMDQLNSKMVEQINKIATEEEKSRKTFESIPILKQFEHAQTKVESHLTCTCCTNILSEPITCVPCGHNFCKKCHYEKSKGKENQQINDKISCMKCGPSTMIYRNESLDEIIEMYTLMKSVKEVMKTYIKKA